MSLEMCRDGPPVSVGLVWPIFYFFIWKSNKHLWTAPWRTEFQHIVLNLPSASTACCLCSFVACVRMDVCPKKLSAVLLQSLWHLTDHLWPTDHRLRNTVWGDVYWVASQNSGSLKHIKRSSFCPGKDIALGRRAWGMQGQGHPNFPAGLSSSPGTWLSQSYYLSSPGDDLGGPTCSCAVTWEGDAGKRQAGREAQCGSVVGGSRGGGGNSASPTTLQQSKPSLCN